MSGPLAQHRTPNRPLFIGGTPIYKVPREGAYPFDLNAIRRTLIPGGVNKNGRCVEWRLQLDLKQRHVLDYRPQPHYPSKHTGGRTFARNARQRRHAANQRARLVQAAKTATIDANKWHMMMPG